MTIFQPGSQMADFNRIARAYRWLEYFSFGRMLERCRYYRLGQIAACRQALVIGDGDGRFAAELMRRDQQIGVEAVDGSPRMLGLLEKRVATAGASSRLTVRCEDARGFSPSGQYDLVVTHFFLDCLSTAEIVALAERVRPHLLRGAMWVVSDFGIPRGVASLPARVVVSFLYVAFGVLTGLERRKLPRHGDALREAGFALADRRTWLGGLLFSEVWRSAGQSESVRQRLKPY